MKIDFFNSTTNQRELIHGIIEYFDSLRDENLGWIFYLVLYVVFLGEHIFQCNSITRGFNRKIIYWK